MCLTWIILHALTIWRYGLSQKVWQGSIFQPYLPNNWKSTNFATEYNYMRGVHMDHIIWQWTVDSSPGKNWTYYPTKMPGMNQINSYDAVGMSLEEAQKVDMKVWLGLVWNSDWWNKYAKDTAWLNQQFQICHDTVIELWTLYGTIHAQSIEGFYISFEVDNVNFISKESQQRITTALADLSTFIHAHTNKSVMVAPFFNSNLGTPDDFGMLWHSILLAAPIDIVAMQDGVGAGHATIADVSAWFRTMSSSIKAARPNTSFWTDLETFGSGYVPAPVSRVIQQLEAERDFVDGVTTFSFNHYDSPQQGNNEQYKEWQTYINKTYRS